MLDELLRAVADGLNNASKRPNFLNYIPHKGAQTDFHKSDSIGRLLFGSNRSGKTVAGIVEDCWWLCGEHPYIKTPEPPIYGRIITVDFPKGEKEIIEPALRQWLPPSKLKNGSWEDSYHKASHKLTLRNGSRLEIMTHDQDLNAFAGVSRHFLHVDEECPKAIFTESRLRLADTNGHYWITMTPVEGLTWIYDKMLDRELKSLEKFHIDVRDNPHISEAARETIRDELDDEDAEIRIGGLFHPKGGKIFREFNPLKHIIPAGMPPRSWTFMVSIDSGINNPTAVLWQAISPEGLVITFYEHYQSNMTVRQHAERIHAINKELKIVPMLYIGDPAMGQRNIVTGSTVFQEYRNYDINVMPGKKDPAGGISKMNDYFRHDLYYITERCPNTIREFRMYSWKTYDSPKTTDKNNKREEPQKKNDHCPDSARYFFSLMPEIDDSVLVRKKPLNWSKTETNPSEYPWHVDTNLVRPTKEYQYGWGEV
jgi:hypothetical protein